MADAMPLKIGDPLPSIAGVERPNGPLVVYFYPRDFTSVCTKEACEFRDIYDVLRKEFNAEVIGISRDSEERHARFTTEHRLPFRLLSDPRGEIAKLFGVGRLWGLLPLAKRITFVADAGGVIRGVFHHELDAARHVRDVRACLEALVK
jgi:thioredoxin-dependent peroxiredoxin